MPMEGYTNIAGAQYDFDDLDIEGRVVDEWNAEDEEKPLPSIRHTQVKQLDERTILSERVKLDNGQKAEVFSVLKKKDSTWYTCHVCSDTVVGLYGLQQHVESNKHRSNMTRIIHPRAKFVKLDPKENLALEPGEPVPPGLEEVIIKSCLIQPKLDACKSLPLIGLEFLVELNQSTINEGVYYFCLLCDKTGSDRNIMIHLTSLFHYMKFLSVYFPTTARKLSSLRDKKSKKKSFGLLVTEIVADIEAKYGRMKPHSETHSSFDSGNRKTELHNAILEGTHFRELDGDLFDEKATDEYLEKIANENLKAFTTTIQIESSDKTEESKDISSSKFNKSSRVSVDKKQLRSREEDPKSSSPDVQIVDIQLPKTQERKKRSRSKSISSVSTVSSSSSKNRNRSHLHNRSRHHSKSFGHSRYHKWMRSRSRSPGYRYSRRRSPSKPYKYSPSRRSRDRSPRGRNRNLRGSPDSHRNKGTDRFGRSRDKHLREKDSEERESPKEVVNSEERVRWKKFREDLKKIESIKLEKLKFHEKNPEKHPQYPEEWKTFWNKRYNELQRSGVDPSKHDFKPEWISFWTKRMKELYEEDLGKAKEELKTKFDLPEDPGNSSHSEKGMPWKHNQRRRNNTSPGLIDVSPPTPDKKDVIADIKTTWKAFTGSDIRDAPKRALSPWEDESKTRDGSPPLKRDGRRRLSRSRSQSPSVNEKLLEDMPQRKSRTSPLIFVLRKLTVLEPQLGSLAPKVFELLSQSLALEKLKEDASLDLLFEEDNCVFLETVREKLIALLCAGIVPRNIVNTARSAIKNTDIALYLASKRSRALPVGSLRSVLGGPMSNQHLIPNPQFVPIQLPKSEPVVVPGVGKVDKVAIAQQIATALVEQGKTNVTEAQLEQLINAVVGMAEASVNSAQPMTTANFLHQLQAMQSLAAGSSTHLPAQTTDPAAHVAPVYKPTPELPKEFSKTEAAVPSPQPFGALKLLQSAYNDVTKSEQDSPKPGIIDINKEKTQPISDEDLAATLVKYNNTKKEEQSSFIQKLQTNNPEMYRRLRPFISSNILSVPEPSKRSPITIPISKAKSEQKVKPTGRLSPFSSRSGGANPTVGERVVIDDDEDDDKTGVKIITETVAKPKESLDLSEYKYSDDDDDDDDYSFEDVYKAAQAKLRQKQLDEDVKSSTIQSDKKDINIIEPIGNNSDESSQTNTNKLKKNETSVASWNITSEDKNSVSSDIFQQKACLKEAKVTPTISAQPVIELDIHEEANEIPLHTTQTNSYQNMGTSSTLTYQELRQQPVKPYNDPSQSFEGGSFQSHPTESQYPNDNSQYAHDPYSLPREPYSNMPREPYGNLQRGPYDNQPREPYDNQPREPYVNAQRDLYNNPQKESFVNPQSDSYGNIQRDPYRNPQRNPYENVQGGSYGNPQSEPYGNPQRESYGNSQQESYGNSQQESYGNTQIGSYRDNFNSSYNTGYGNQPGSYSDQFRYKEGDDYVHARPNTSYPSSSYPPGPGPRYPNPSYPPY